MEYLITDEMKLEIQGIINSNLNISNYLKVYESSKGTLFHAEIDMIKKEICICLLFNLTQASITLTNHLLEKFLKLSLIYKDAGIHQLTDIETIESTYAQSIDKYYKIDLEDAINRARTKQIITKDEKKRLLKYKEDFRNAYSHADMKKTFGNLKIPIALGKFDNSSKLEIKEISVAKVPFLQGMAQKKLADNEAIPYFLYVDQIIIRVGQEWNKELINKIQHTI